MRDNSANFFTDEVRRDKQQRKARGVFGILVSVALFPRKGMGFQFSRIKLKIVFIPVVVEEIDVSVREQALCDQQVMGFVPCYRMGRKNHSRGIQDVCADREDQHDAGCFFWAKNRLLDGLPFLCRHWVLRRTFDQTFPKVMLQIGRAENRNEK